VIGPRLARIELPIVLGALSLFASVTNLIPASTTFFLLIALLPALIWRGSPMPRVVLAALCLMGYLVLQTLLYDPSALLNYHFMRRDGNVFITLMPLLIFGLWRLPVNLERMTRSFLVWSGAVNALLVVVYLVLGNVHYRTTEPTYLFLFVAHNAAGGYLATVAALCIGFYVATRDRWIGLAALSHLIGLWLSDSRGSELGLLIGLGIHFALRERRRWWLPATLLATVILALLLSWSIPFYRAHTVSEQEPNPGIELAIQRHTTILTRVCYLWPKAVDLWLASPFVGVGFGAYNDTPIRLRGIPYLFSWNGGANRVYSDGHAHQTFLHVMAETGLVGLVLLLWLLAEMRRTCLQIESPALRRGLLLALWTAIWSSWTEHRLFTPSQMLPLLLILGLSLALTEKSPYAREA
jgi:O-antigen ligase